MLPGNERIHHNGEDYVPAYWLTVGKDALNAALAEIDALTAALAAERASADDLADSVAKLRARRSANGEPWIRDRAEAGQRLDRHCAAREEADNAS